MHPLLYSSACYVAWVCRASTRAPLVGGSLLLTYTTGYVARLLLAASFAGSLQPAFIPQVLSMDQSNEMIGLIKPTSGSAYVEGLDIWTEMNRIYTSMGVCPQHDFPWGILTGREHLLFYGRLKNLKVLPQYNGRISKECELISWWGGRQTSGEIWRRHEEEAKCCHFAYRSVLVSAEFLCLRCIVYYYLY